LFAILSLGMAASVSLADMRALIEQALDEPAAITLDNITLGDAIAVLTDQTGVTLRMPPDVMALVPHGDQTLIREVQIANMPLRQGLVELFGPLGMTFVVHDAYVEIVPKEALRCLARPATWVELDALVELSAMQPGIDAEAMAQLQSKIQFLVPVPNGWSILSGAVRSVGAGPGDEVLTIACDKLGWGWCLSDQHIVVESREQQIRRQLEQPISLRMNNRPLFEILQELGDRTNVPVRAEPGALAALPLHIQKNFSVNVRNQRAEHVIEAICAETGLGYLLEPGGVLLYHPTATGGPATDDPKATTNVSMADPYIGKLVVPLEDGTSMEWLIRQSELPEDLRDMRQRDIEAMINTLRRKAGGS
jgi:hypothetical protein